jgi:putative oxidoreductase
MDWNRLIHFALPGGAGLEQYAILLVRVSIGLFFAISGANKWFKTGGTKPIVNTLVKGSVSPADGLFRGGGRVRLRVFADGGASFEPGVFSVFDRYGCADIDRAISTFPKGLSPLNWLDDFLYLPEVLYGLFFIWLLCSSPGRFSVDYWLAGKLLN